MFKTLRSRLWLGYSLLILLVLAAFIIGLIVTLNRTSALFRTVELQLRLEEQTLTRAIEKQPTDVISAIKSSLIERPAQNAIRVIVLDNQGVTIFDSQTGNTPAIQWKTLAGIRRTENLNSSNVVRDAEGKNWLYIGKKMTAAQQYLVIAAPRTNLTLKFMVSDPMTRMIFRVLIFSILISIILTVMMDRWVAEPIRRMSKSAATMAFGAHSPLLLEGPTEVKQLATTLNQMSQQVSESQQSQRDFVSDVSHELKTPLTSIQGFANAVLDGTANDEKSIKHAVQVIASESERMLRLVLDLLTLTKLEGGVEHLHKSPIYLPDLIDGVVEKMSVAAKSCGINIVTHVQELPVVMADGDRINQIFTNLVDNAIKFSKPGGKVTISSESGKQTIQIHVADQGIGISTENQAKIFNRFYQADRSRTGGARKSAGLGLPIARQIAQAHGGDILVTSEIGQGTIFTFVMPISNIK